MNKEERKRMIEQDNQASLIYKILGEVKGKRILELGCGSKEDIGCHQPDDARFFSYLGADVTGVDIRPSPGEPYNHVVMDLARESLVNKFGENSFDVVTSNSFFDSPELIRSLDRLNPSSTTTRANYEPFCRRICKEINKILRDNGIFLDDDGSMLWCEGYGRNIIQGSGFSLIFEDPVKGFYKVWRKD